MKTGRKTGRWLSAIVVASLISGLLVPRASAFKIPTHELLNLRSVGVSTADAILTNELGIRGGLTETIRRSRIVDWIRDGGAAEDQYFGDERLGAVNRSKHHFHNPLLGWDVAGLDGRCAVPFRGQASVRWAQATDQAAQAFESATWADARRQFRDFLTLGSGSAREEAGAQMFRILGQQMHLIADLAAPAHVRNDIHCTPRAEAFEVWAATGFALGLIQGLRSEDVVRPDDAIFAIPLPPGELVATVPVARLWDSDQYDRTNPDITRRPTIGLAEYTNANFFSGNTIFAQDFPFPARTSVDLLEPPEPEPKKGELRRYLTKVRHGVTVNHLAVPSALYEFLPDALKDKKIGLDDNVFSDYAQLLFPRAVGYSAALLDYFFRGKLDVDLFSDDGSTLQVRGTNASPDPLVDGTLKLYADVPTLDPAGRPTTVRRELAALGDTNVRGVDPGHALSSALFQPQEAERFMAVYQGRLGNEIPVPNPDTPSLSFPGGVIGKVLGGARVEEVFADGDRWKLRTPQGVFLLKVADQPLTGGEFADVRWGDGDSLLVARTPIGRNQPNRIVVYEVPRQAGSMELVSVDGPHGVKEVVLKEKTAVVFPFGMALGTTVQLSQTIQYRQQLVRSDPHKNVWKFVDIDCAPLGLPPPCGFYEFDHFEHTPTVEVLHQQTVSLADNFPLVLDRARMGAFRSTRYYWSLEGVAADASGRPLGLVVVYLTSPESPRVSVPFSGVNAQGNLEVLQQISLGAGFPSQIDVLLWAVVDLQEGRVVASTADPVVKISEQFLSEAPSWSCPGCGPRPLVYAHAQEEFVGGPMSGIRDAPGWTAVGPLPQPVTDPLGTVTGLQQAGGGQTTVDGWMRTELKDLGLFDFELRTLEGSADFLYCLFECNTLRVGVSNTLVLPAPKQLLEARRARPAPGSERLVFMVAQMETDRPLLVVWDPTSRTAQIRHQFPGTFPILVEVTGTTALASSFHPSGGSLIPLAGPDAPVFVPDENLFSSFTLLHPSLLYNVDDLKFYRSTPPLQGTALPRKLADAEGNPRGDYHAIRLP